MTQSCPYVGCSITRAEFRVLGPRSNGPQEAPFCNNFRYDNQLSFRISWSNWRTSQWNLLNLLSVSWMLHEDCYSPRPPPATLLFGSSYSIVTGSRPFGGPHNQILKLTIHLLLKQTWGILLKTCLYKRYRFPEESTRENELIRMHTDRRYA
jgi:hypothetical protein